MLRALILVGVALAAPASTAQPPSPLLPAGRLLVVSAEGGGVWVVAPDGKRRIGIYDDARWSPSGRFVVAARPNALLALAPNGAERWSLPRRDVYAPVWGGRGADMRIAYADAVGLRVVGGDGRRDRLLAPAESGPFAWRPGGGHELAYLSASELRLQDVDSGRVRWRALAGSPWAALGLSWSGDGERVLAAFDRELLVFDADGRKLRRLPFRSVIAAASFAPAGRTVAVLLRTPGVVDRATSSSLRVLDADGGGRRTLADVRGEFGELAWSPDGRIVLVASRFEDRWLFVNGATGKTRAVDGIAARFPRPEGRPADLLFLSGRWCCAG